MATRCVVRKALHEIFLQDSKWVLVWRRFLIIPGLSQYDILGPQSNVARGFRHRLVAIACHMERALCLLLLLQGQSLDMQLIGRSTQRE